MDSRKRREPKAPSQAVLVIAVMWKNDFSESERKSSFDRIISRFGSIRTKSMEYIFEHTSYYKIEMGESLKKVFIEVEPMVFRESLVNLKLQAIEIEEIFADPLTGARRINIDPMLVTLENVVIATTKNFPHRAYLSNGIFADVHLIRQSGCYQTLPWTYEDYKDHIPFLDHARTRCKN